MDKQTGIAAVVATVTGLVSAGAFKFYEFALKQKREIAKDEQTDKAMYRDDLIKRVDKLEEERVENLNQIMDLMMSITAMKVELEYLKRDNEVLKVRLDALR
jgi:hypothetical protein|tara:strand:- start:174 stop:479 length:306 start_codon:yes stop_codon:yes gene_type:complete